MILSPAATAAVEVMASGLLPEPADLPTRYGVGIYYPQDSWPSQPKLKLPSASCTSERPNLEIFTEPLWFAGSVNVRIRPCGGVRVTGTGSGEAFVQVTDEAMRVTSS